MKLIDVDENTEAAIKGKGFWCYLGIHPHQHVWRDQRPGCKWKGCSWHTEHQAYRHQCLRCGHEWFTEIRTGW